MEMSLQNVNDTHKEFIRELFWDNLVRKFVIIDQEIGADVGELVDVWLDDARRNAGGAWIVYDVKPASFLQPEKLTPCGYIAFERRSQNSGRITYALLEKYRGKGFIKTALKAILQHLGKIGIQIVEADIDSENIASQKVVEVLGFTANKKAALFDFNHGGKIRHLWKKELY